MNLSRVKIWAAEILYASDLNAEFDNILNHEVANADISVTAAIEGSKLKNADIDLTTKVKGVLPVSNGGTGKSDDTYDADKVDGFDASAAAAANRLLALDANVQFPAGVLAQRASVYVATEEGDNTSVYKDCTYGAGSLVLASNSMVIIGWYAELKGTVTITAWLKLVFDSVDITGVAEGEGDMGNLMMEASHKDTSYEKFARMGVLYAAAGAYTIKFRRHAQDGGATCYFKNKGWWAIGIPIA